MSRLNLRLADSHSQVELIALVDAEGAFFQPRSAVFLTPTDEEWQAADALDPDAVRDDDWWMHFRCFALRFDDGRVVLFDLGVGPSSAPSKSWAPVPGRLPHELASAHLSPESVTTVVLSHMHTDHIGWTTDGNSPSPLFANARYLLQQTEIELIDQRIPAVRSWLLDPLRASGQLEAVNGDKLLQAGVRIVATPGHTPGHQSLVLDSDSSQVLLTGDLFAGMVQLVNPRVTYLHDMDQDQARETRVATMRELGQYPGALLASAHLGYPFVHLDTLAPVDS